MSLKINCDSSVSKITGKLKLYDYTAKKTLATWDISIDSNSLIEVKTFPATEGHTYTVSFSGYAYYSSGSRQGLTGSTTKSYT
jgi:hypothetical protein